MEVGRVRELRLELGLSQERFARLLGVSLQTVRRWEAGLSKPLPFISVRLDELRKEMRSGDNRKGERASDSDNKTRQVIELGMGGVFKSIGGLLDMVSKMTDEGTNEDTRFGETHLKDGKIKGVYGITVKLGLGGKPVIEQFGNIKATENGAEVAEVREPLTDVLDEDNRVVVIAEMPGVDTADVKIEVRGDILILKADGKYRRYSKELLLPSRTLGSQVKSSCNNGILTIELAKE